MFDQIPILRQAGFFLRYAHLTDEQLLSTLQQQHQAEYARLFDEAHQAPDFDHLVQLLEYDREKFLHIDLEADVMEGNEVYVRVINRLAERSGGLFTPTDVREVWHTHEGPIRVSFIHKGERITFEPEYEDDWLDDEVFTAVNQQMASSGERFWLCYGPAEKWSGQDVVFIRLTDLEKNLLADNLGWVFPEY